ncbi:MAG: hypothetical protein UX31_C0033G0017 [Candidatus Nomurabacteria bacterium GW2011_GWA1_46_11]|uniref:Uncharacterized protein n=2 Tax=Candidatus Nomuraibacteriota TaxID=1752729 RepID=A0A0G1W0A6_9BACT|nr:MAG: hypothetical protein UX31_C0033G0017 [Candidatus Nomurabacteria bacterium GW2011_GWA1_46_11]KKU75740.1 MAG: hypothetical protein UY01_C0005G0007 [Candidatus Nomurabacteria bacterium GW2011_GWB1_47_6]
MYYNGSVNGIEESQVFFIISSVGFVLLWAFVAVLLFYLIRITRSFSRIMDKIEGGVNQIGDTTKELLEDLRDSALFHFLFRRKKKSRKDKEEGKN